MHACGRFYLAAYCRAQNHGLPGESLNPGHLGQQERRAGEAKRFFSNPAQFCQFIQVTPAIWASVSHLIMGITILLDREVLRMWVALQG
jgi:hypothetical protein